MTAVDTTPAVAGTSAPTITVYSKPLCVQCDATKRELVKQGRDFTVVDITQDEEAMARVRELGHVAAPVVVLTIGGQVVGHWSQFRLEELRAIPA